MVNLISAENIGKTFGFKHVLNHVSIGINTGDRIGIVGLNGEGKTTLINILSGREQPDSGRVARNTTLRMGVVTQTTRSAAGATVGSTILQSLNMHTYEWAANPRIRKIIDGLEITNLGLETAMSQLSGGEIRRVHLAAVLVQELDLIILDEPTNHLDIEAIQWLANYLVNSKLAVVVVTHDRWFLDTVATITWEVHDGYVDTYAGGYNDWIFARAERTRQANAIEQHRQNLARKELAWLRRGAPARTSKPRYRIEAAETIIKKIPPHRDTVQLMAFARKRLGKVVIELDNATITTEECEPATIFTDLTWRLSPGERIGLVGKNGSGKTTLFAALAGEKALKSGKRIEGKTVHLGWLRQELDDMDKNQTVIEAVQSIANYIAFGDKELSAAQLAERLGFSAQRQRTVVRDLSGGELRRLQLTRILMAEPNVLLLDEPTNDLDIDTLQELEALLDMWSGTLVVISHDRFFIERVTDTVWAVLGDQKITHLPGGIEQYLQISSQEAKKTTHQCAKRDVVGLSAAERHRMGKEQASLERKINKIREEVRELNTVISRLSLENKYEEVMRMHQRITELTHEHDAFENRWFEIEEMLEK